MQAKRENMNMDGKSYRLIGNEVYYNQMNIVKYLYGYCVKYEQIKKKINFDKLWLLNLSMNF